MAEDNYNHLFYIPKTFVVGIDQENDAGFPTMKDHKGNWKSAGVFKNICGFQPWEQRDKSKEISKVLQAAVQTVDNAPTAGFKILSLHKNAYCPKTSLYYNIETALLQDPRGWNVVVPLRSLDCILSNSGWNVKDGEILGVKLMYAWKSECCADKGMRIYCNRGPFELVPECKESLASQADTVKLLDKKDSAEYIKPSKFVIGKVYSSKVSKLAGHNYMYLGTSAVYSPSCQQKALRKGSYEHLKQCIEDRTDITAESRHIFYCIDFNMPEIVNMYSGNTCRRPGYEPYCVMSSLSKVFEIEEPAACDGKTMHNSRLPLTLENIKEDMATSALFNKLSFSSRAEAPVDIGMFAEAFLDKNIHDIRAVRICHAYPFCPSWYYVIMDGSVGKFRIRVSSYGSSKISVLRPDIDRYSWYSSNNPPIEEHVYGNFSDYKDIMRKLHEKFRPSVSVWQLENGKQLQMWQCFALNEQCG